MTIAYIIGIGVILLIVASIISLLIGKNIGKKAELKEQQLAKQTAQDFLNNAQQKIEHEQKVSLLETKEQIRELEQKKQKEFDLFQRELLERENDVKIAEKEIAFKDQSLQSKSNDIKKTSEALEGKITEFNTFVVEQKAAIEQQVLETARMSEVDAQAIVLKQAKKSVERDVAELIRDENRKAKHRLKQKSKQILIQSMQKYTSSVATERTVSIVNLPNDELKGRLIGREGRNIRSIETLTGVDVIIDDTPETIVLSCFDPIRRELARMLVQDLVDDGRIHPGRIEEVYAQKVEELDIQLVEFGEQTLNEMNLPMMDTELLKLIGKLHFRTSYGQNILQHSKEVGYISGIIATELGEDVVMAKRAGLLHDIGKAVDFETEGTHIDLGVKIARKFQEPEIVENAIASHHGDVAATSIISEIVAIADGLSATRPGARRESLESYITRLTELEALPMHYDGVEKAYAIQAGREIRVLINPESMNDDRLEVLAHDIKEEIQDKLQYPGTIKVTVIRETRAIDVAK